MDYRANGLQTGFLQIGELDKMVRECRSMASKLGLMLNWRVKKRTATAFIKFNHHVLWKAEYTNDTPHMVIVLMYFGVHAELKRREKENQEAILRMKELEQQRQEEKRVAGLPSWKDRIK